MRDVQLLFARVTGQFDDLHAVPQWLGDGIHPVRRGDEQHLYREDIANAHAMGINTFRFGVEWARVMPEPGKWDDSELAYYDDVVATLRRNRMTPMITLMHWVYPGWVADRGGFLNNVDAYADFAKAITKRYAGQGVLWVSVNEPVAFDAMELSIGAIKSAEFDTFLDRVADAHRAVYRAAHDADPDAKVTANEGYMSPDQLAQYVGPGADPISFFDRIKDTVDYIDSTSTPGRPTTTPCRPRTPPRHGVSSLSPKTSTTLRAFTPGGIPGCLST